jgi:outer membrane receptor protein involved in Fe transport
MQNLSKGALRLFLITLILAAPGIFKVTHSQAITVSGISENPITVNFKNSSLREAMDEIRKKSGLGIIYNDSDLPAEIRVSYQVQNKPVREVLDHLFKNTQLGYKEYKGSLVIYVKESSGQKKTNNLGSLLGTLSNAETGEVLIGATVLIIGTAWGSTTDVDGRYSIKNIPVGNYQLAISYIGYENAIVRDVKIEGGETIALDYKLKPSTTQLQDVEIIGDKALSGNVVETNEISMVNQIKASSSIITGISAQQIARSVDQDAGQVARRLPGVAVLNNFVNIRGMHERYNLTYLNGMVAPSSETDTRAFSYDLLPSSMIDKMTVYRSPAPELLADWAGGAIKIETKNTSIARQIEVNFSTWFRPGSSFEDYHTYEGGKRDWLGRDDGTRALPGGFPETGQIPAGGFADVEEGAFDPRAENNFTAEQLAQNVALGRKMYSRWNLQKASHGLDYRGGINYYDAVKLGKMRLSNLTSLSTTQAMQIIHQDFAPQAAGFTRDGNNVAGKYFRDTISQIQARWSVVQNLRLDINPRHFLEAKGLYNQLGTDETLVRDGYVGRDADVGLGYQTRVLYTYRSRAVLATQLAGSHSLGKNENHVIQWAGGYGYSEDNTPAQRLLKLEPLNPDDPVALRSLNDNPGYGETLQNSHYYTLAFEKNYTFSLDYVSRLPEGYFFKIGAFNEIKDRNVDARKIVFGNLFRNGADGSPLTQWNADEMFSMDRYLDDGSGTFIYDNQYLNGQFSVSSSIIGLYGAVNIPLLNKKLNIYGGVRYEGQDLLLESPASITNPAQVYTDRYLFYWLPSVNVSYNFTDKVLLRGAYGKTLNRPNFRELMPYLVQDPKLDRTLRGDSSLVDAEIHNFDLRLEYYPGEGEFISLGAYYKKLSNAIEPYIERQGNSTEIVNPSNTPEATVFGVEAEVRKSLGFLPWRWARHFSVISNVALLKSKVQYQDSLFSLQNSDFRMFSRPLEGTASFVINAGIYYDHEEWGTKISALYNVLGQRLILAPTSLFPAYYEMPRHVIDLTVRQRITKHIEMRAGVQDILNQPVRRYADYDRNEYWSRHDRSKWPYKDWMFQEFRPGSYYMMGVNFTF